MKVAVVARELETSRRGVARWLREVLSAWRRTGRDRDTILYVERELPADFELGAFDVRAIGRAAGGGATRWEQQLLVQALARDRPAAVLGPTNALPLRTSTPGVLVLHDLSFEARPDWFSPREGTRLRLLARWSCQRAKRIVVVSQFTADELNRLYGVAGRFVRVVPNGVSEHFTPLTDPTRLAAVRRRYDLDGDVVLAVGSIFQRRRLPDLAAAFALVLKRFPRAQLVILGDNRTHPRLDIADLLLRLNITSRCRWIVEVPEEDLVALYTIAQVSVYLSDYEGFGIPPLEALACGSHVVASDIPALRENLFGRASLLSPDQHAPEPIAECLSALLAVRRDNTKPSWLDHYSWATAADAVHTTLEEVARCDRP